MLPVTAPSCPYCGYDQSGVVASWADRCPRRSPCSECGTELDWQRVFAQHSELAHRPQPGISGTGCATQTVLLVLGIPAVLLAATAAVLYLIDLLS